jgi:hypothetical protein
MNFTIVMDVPEMSYLWNDLQQNIDLAKSADRSPNCTKNEAKNCSCSVKAPKKPSPHAHEIEPLSARYGIKVWQSYLESRTSDAMRMYWV